MSPYVSVHKNTGISKRMGILVSFLKSELQKLLNSDEEIREGQYGNNNYSDIKDHF